MEQIIEICNAYLDLEKRLQAAFLQKSPALHNELLEQMASLLGHSDLSIEYVAREGDWEEEEATEYAEMLPYEKRRQLCKISQYKFEEEPYKYCCYISRLAYDSSSIFYSKAFFWQVIDGVPVIIADLTWPRGGAATKKWRFNRGDDALSNFKTLGKPTQILRLLPPEGEPASMKDYLKDK